MHNNMSKAEEIKKRLEEIEAEKKLYEAERELQAEQLNFKSFKNNVNRARSITVGTAFGGVTEVSMRGDGCESLWVILQPVEVTELIHQLASNIGCHINLQPRQDFASWRHWRDDNQSPLLQRPENIANTLDPYMDVGLALPDTGSNKGSNEPLELRNKQDALATKKTINKRKPKQPSTAA